MVPNVLRSGGCVTPLKVDGLEIDLSDLPCLSEYFVFLIRASGGAPRLELFCVEKQKSEDEEENLDKVRGFDFPLRNKAPILEPSKPRIRRPSDIAKGLCHPKLHLESQRMYRKL
jgi:hypothetical protein